MSSRDDIDPRARPCREQVTKMFASHPGAGEERLASVVFDDIVPRLRMLHHKLSPQDAERNFTKADIAEFGKILIGDDGAAADQFLQSMRARHYAEDTLILGLLSEAARHLGALWEDDRCSFVDVTIGVARLQKLLCIFSGRCEPVFSNRRQRAALCALSGERHVFGLDMVACFLRHACWDVDLQKDADEDDIAGLVGGAWFAVLGFTLSSEMGLEALCRAIKSGRAASVNPHIGVLVGGQLFRINPCLVAQVGADAMAGDAASATLLAKKLLLIQAPKGGTGNGHRVARSVPAEPVSFIQASKA